VPTYSVTWQLEVEADSPSEAAREALRIQHDPLSIARVFEVEGPGGRFSFDLGDRDLRHTIWPLSAEDLRCFAEEFQARGMRDVAIWLRMAERCARARERRGRL
jgi:hypothetical protein